MTLGRMNDFFCQSSAYYAISLERNLFAEKGFNWPPAAADPLSLRGLCPGGAAILALQLLHWEFQSDCARRLGGEPTLPLLWKPTGTARCVSRIFTQCLHPRAHSFHQFNDGHGQRRRSKKLKWRISHRNLVFVSRHSHAESDFRRYHNACRSSLSTYFGELDEYE
jgi:hypothetical protein